MKQLLFFITITTAIASSSLSAHSTILSNANEIDRSPEKIGELALNPQPLPPRYLDGKSQQLGDTLALNPQPLPPRWK